VEWNLAKKGRLISIILVTLALTLQLVCAAQLPPVKLIWYFPIPSQPDQAEVYAAANKIIEKAINATVDFKQIEPGNYNDKMLLITSSGEPYDICWTANWRNNYYQNVAKGAFLPVGDLLKKFAPKLRASVPKKVWDAALVNGKLYGVINNQVMTMTNGFFLRKDLVDKYKFDLKTMRRPQDLEPFLKTLKQNEPTLIPLAVMNNQQWGNLLVYYNFDEIGGRNIPGVVRMNDSKLKVINQFTTPEFKEFLIMMRDWYNKGYVRPDAFTVADTTPDLKAFKHGAAFSGNVKPGADSDWFLRTNNEVYAVAVTKPVLLTSSCIATMQAISRTSANPERAMMFLELLNNNKELFNLISFGIEGQHYRKVGENRIELVPESKYRPGNAWTFGNQFNAYLIPGQSDTLWDETRKGNLSAKVSPLLGFAFNSEPVKSELAQCQSVINEFMPGFLTGAVDVDANLAKFLDKLEKAGASRLIAEMQKQIDAWKKAR